MKLESIWFVDYELYTEGRSVKHSKNIGHDGHIKVIAFNIYLILWVSFFGGYFSSH